MSRSIVFQDNNDQHRQIVFKTQTHTNTGGDIVSSDRST
jgi:hypothetical protein